MKRLAVIGVLLLCGCETPHVSSGTEAGGIVSSYGWQPNKSLRLADAYCRKYGKHARVSHENDLQDHMTFDCV